MEYNEEDVILITDENIVSFYKKNPNLDIVGMNLVFIDIIKKLSVNLSDTLQTTLNSNILSMVSAIQSNMDCMKNALIIKLHEAKKEYMEDMKHVMENNSLNNNEKIASFIEKHNENLMNKTSVLLGDVLPKNQENMENQFNKMLMNVQQPIFSFIQSSEERTNHGIQQVKEIMVNQKIHQEKLTGELHDFLNKYKNNSSSKGNISEAELYYILQKIMPSDEILRVGSDSATCDFKVNRLNNKPSILFENKDYARSVTKDEIKKFERDVQLQKNHGIFISQNSPITFKQNYQIDIINGLIHVYIPNCEYDANKIKIGIDIIDNLALKLDVLTSENSNDYCMTKEVLDEILEEYKFFVNQKLMIMDIIKTNNKQLLDKMEEIQFPNLKKLFIKTGNIENDNDFKCMYCNQWSGKNKVSLGAHVRNCKWNPKNKGEEVIQINTSENEFLENNVEMNENNEKNKKKKKKSSQNEKEKTYI